MLKWFHHQAVESMPTDCIWKWRNFSFIWFGEYMNDNDFYQTDIIQCWRIDIFTHIVHNCNFQEEDEWHCMISLEVKNLSKLRSEFFIIMLFTYIICLLFVCVNSPVLFVGEQCNLDSATLVASVAADCCTFEPIVSFLFEHKSIFGWNSNLQKEIFLNH